MKKKGFCSGVVALALACNLATPALAAQGADARLAQVTLAVKATLNVDDSYTEFYGEPRETPLGTQWSLSWSEPNGRSLSVTCTDTGKILALSRNSATEPVTYPIDNGPHFPSLTQNRAYEIAQAFVAQVFEGNETADFDALPVPSLGQTRYNFSGSICLNETPAPLRFSVRVDVAEEAVTYFRRDDQSSYVGEVPAPTTVTTVSAARALLADTLKFDLYYVYDSEKKQAVLRYNPCGTNDYYVDAATGELVDLTALRAKLNPGSDGFQASGSVSNKMALDAAPEAAPTLTPTELEGIAKLEGVLPQEELAAKAKAWEALKLSGFEASACSYSVEREDPDAEPTDEPAKVTARLTLTQVADDGIRRRTLNMDARTGELQSMYGYDPYVDEPAKVTEETAKAAAEAFLAKLWGDQYAKTELYQSYPADKLSDAHTFTFAQKVNGYFYPANALTVRVSARDGAVVGFSTDFDDSVTFAAAENLITLAEAKAAWADTYALELTYIPVPVELDPLGEPVRPLRNAGYRYYNALKPGYQWGEQEGWCQGVDAKTGEIVRTPRVETERLAYDDIAGHWAEAQLGQLALYQVGWSGGKALPDKALTQLDYIVLLAGMKGSHFGPDAKPDEIYAYAYRNNLLTQEERDEAKELTRADMVKMLLDSLGYKFVANLPNIYRCDFTDADTIPAGHMGYAALGQALGLVEGDDSGAYAPARPATRAEAAMMLWRYLNR